jgi:hypothetical protein
MGIFMQQCHPWFWHFSEFGLVDVNNQQQIHQFWCTAQHQNLKNIQCHNNTPKNV